MHNARTVGVWALVAAIVAPVWLFAGLYLVVGATQVGASPVVLLLANVAAFGWFMVPLAVVAALVLSILAIAKRRGKGFGIAALVVLLLSALAVVLFVAVSFGRLPS
ncbi:MAG: hypothetical protein KF761_09185 [Salinibacterium sp.]|nr:hypothetical protein [Salinibacterium sp.]